MALDNETVKRIAFLSKLKIDENKLDDTREEFNKILAWVEELGEVNTDSVEPLVSVNEERLSLREDIITTGNLSQEILENAPNKEYGYFVVPKVVE